MKRHSFLRTVTAAGALLMMPFASGARALRKLRVNKGFKVDSGKDRFDKSITLLEGDTFYTKISSDDTGGDIYAFESNRLKKGGPPCILISVRTNGGTY